MKYNKNIFYSVLLIAFLIMVAGCVPPVPQIIEVTEVNIPQEDQSLEVGSILQLSAVVTPANATNKAVEWKSSNSNIATVSEEGLVTAISIGAVDITVTTDDGSFTDTVKINIIAQYGNGDECDTCPPSGPTKYALTMAVSPANSGTANDTTNNSPYVKDAVVNIQATPEDGWAFVDWSAPTGVFGDKDNPNTTFTMPGQAVTVTANFEEVYPVNFEITGSPGIPDALIEIFSDEAMTNKVTEISTDGDGEASVELPDGDYWFKVTKDGYVDYQGSFTVNGGTVNLDVIDMDKILHVTFSIVNPAGGTLIAEVDGTEISSGDEVIEGKEVIFTASPVTGAKVKEWKLDGSVAAGETGNTYTVSDLQADIEVTVEFERKPCFEPRIAVSAEEIRPGDTFTIEWYVKNKGSVADTQDVLQQVVLKDKDGNIKHEGAGTTNTVTLAAGEEKLVATNNPNTAAGKVWAAEDGDYFELTLTTDCGDPATQRVDVVIPKYLVTFNPTPRGGSLIAEVDGTEINSGDEVPEGKDVVFTVTPIDVAQVNHWEVNSTEVPGEKDNIYTYLDLQMDIDVAVFMERIPSVVDPDNSSASFMDNTNGTGTMTLTIMDQFNVPMDGFGLADMEREIANWVNFEQINTNASWDVSLESAASGIYEVLFTYSDNGGNYGPRNWNIRVDNVVIEENLSVQITYIPPAFFDASFTMKINGEEISDGGNVPLGSTLNIPWLVENTGGMEGTQDIFYGIFAENGDPIGVGPYPTNPANAAKTLAPGAQWFFDSNTNIDNRFSAGNTYMVKIETEDDTEIMYFVAVEPACFEPRIAVSAEEIRPGDILTIEWYATNIGGIEDTQDILQKVVLKDKDGNIKHEGAGTTYTETLAPEDGEVLLGTSNPNTAAGKVWAAEDGDYFELTLTTDCGDPATQTVNVVAPFPDDLSSSVAWIDNEDGTGTMTLTIIDQDGNPMDGFGLIDMERVVTGGINWRSFDNINGFASWDVDLQDVTNGVYTVLFTYYDGEYGPENIDVRVDGYVIEENLEVGITDHVSDVEADVSALILYMESGFASSISNQSTYPYSAALPITGPSGTTIKWQYILSSGDIILDSSFEDDDNGWDLDPVEWQFDDGASDAAFTASVSKGTVEELIDFTISVTGTGAAAVFTINYIP